MVYFFFFFFKEKLNCVFGIRNFLKICVLGDD